MGSRGPAISVERLGKVYRVAPNRPRRDTLADALERLMRRPLRPSGAPRSPDETFWALREVSFAVQPGEVVGVIGRNGAGKSTLLKVLSRITSPTEGRVEIRGRVASLLEVGTGFHPELTGRENVYMNGSILGMRRAEIDRKFDEIVDFAGVERFLDTPLKRYSSGMQVRLAFAVAAHLDPEILIVDEVLAVGDAEFQRKCIGKMSAVSAQEGRTILLVSHNMTAIRSLCDRAIWLDAGRIAADGPDDDVAARYLASRLGAPEQVPARGVAGSAAQAVEIQRVRIVPSPREANEITVRTPFAIEIDYATAIARQRLHVTIHLSTLGGGTVLCSGSETREHDVGLHRATCAFPAPLLNDGTYEVRVQFVRNLSEVVVDVADALAFAVNDVARPVGTWQGKWPGVVRPDLAWRVDTLEAHASPGPAS